MSAVTPFIPEYITVHLGRPDVPADNVTVGFADYIKNVASSEIYPTWPYEALKANILAQISFALNRVYTEWYRGRGYDFDITNSTSFDQSFVYGRNIPENIDRLVNEIFNTYIKRPGSIEPLFTVYCDGRQVYCNGLQQFDTVYLARQGYTAEQMLRYFYGDNIEIVYNAPVRNLEGNYPGIPLKLGMFSSDIQLVQIWLNRIAANYPAIPKIYPVNGLFAKSTEDAVIAFQRIFGLVPDGIVGKATWYRLEYIFSSVKRLGQLDSEGFSFAELPDEYRETLKLGDSGIDVRRFQYILAVIGQYFMAVRPIRVTGVYDYETESAVRDYQSFRELKVDGIAGPQTYMSMYYDYLGILETGFSLSGGVLPYPGEVLAPGSTGPNVRTLQNLLSGIAKKIEIVPDVTADGVFGPKTEASVKVVQKLYGLEQDGFVGPITWDAIASLYASLYN